MADDSTKVPPDVDDYETLAVKVVPLIPDDSRLLFSDNIAVQHTPTEFTLTFSQIRQPLVSDESGYEGLTEVRADVVARIVLTPAKMIDLIRTLRDNWSLYQRRIKKIMEEQALASAEQQHGGTDNRTENTLGKD